MPETLAIVASAERVELLAALDAHAAACQAWLPRDRVAAWERAIVAFDTMHDRLEAAKPVGAIDATIVERIRESYEHARSKRYLAVNLDMELVLAVLNAIDANAAHTLTTGATNA